jgi:lysozyme family protein
VINKLHEHLKNGKKRKAILKSIAFQDGVKWYVLQKGCNTRPHETCVEFNSVMLNKDTLVK